jgi:hypothetical protein
MADLLAGVAADHPLATPDDGLRHALEGADDAAIRSAATAVLDDIAMRLGWTLGGSVVRRRNDGSLRDRWPGVAKALRTTDSDDAAEQVTFSPVFRDVVAARAPRARGSASAAETARFGRAVLALLDRTRCAGCAQWWSATPGASRWTCRCGRLVVVSRTSTR